MNYLFYASFIFIFHTGIAFANSSEPAKEPEVHMSPEGTPGSRQDQPSLIEILPTGDVPVNQRTVESIMYERLARGEFSATTASEGVSSSGVATDSLARQGPDSSFFGSSTRSEPSQARTQGEPLSRPTHNRDQSAVPVDLGTAGTEHNSSDDINATMALSREPSPSAAGSHGHGVFPSSRGNN
jgi:hypothetical protein